jgi:hypothetical protein
MLIEEGWRENIPRVCGDDVVAAIGVEVREKGFGEAVAAAWNEGIEDTVPIC